MKVAIITEQQKDLITGKEYTKDMTFNPVQDANDNWVVSEEEINQCHEEYCFLRELPLQEHQPKIHIIGDAVSLRRANTQENKLGIFARIWLFIKKCANKLIKIFK